MPTYADVMDPIRHEHSTERIAGRLGDLIAARFDVVAPQAALVTYGNGGRATLGLPEPLLLDDGVLDADALDDLTITRTALRHLAERARMPLTFVDRLADDRSDDVRSLIDINLNNINAVDGRTALYRMLRTDDRGYVLRAVLSDRFSVMDNELVLRAIMNGLGGAGVGLGDCEVDGDVTPDRLRLRIAVPAIAHAVPDLLGDYRMPFSMRDDRAMHARPETGETPPVMWAGLEVTNSETGGGAFALAPRAVIQVCRNGLTRPVEFRRAHVGSVLTEGVIDWSANTRTAALELITSQVADAVRQFCSVDYLTRLADEMRAAKGIVISEPVAAVTVAQRLAVLSDAETADVLACFSRGGDFTLLGVGNAVTAAAQMVTDGDRQAEMEQAFWKIVNAPAAFADAVAS